MHPYTNKYLVVQYSSKDGEVPTYISDELEDAFEVASALKDPSVDVVVYKLMAIGLFGGKYHVEDSQ